jgi:hypothetical protein
MMAPRFAAAAAAATHVAAGRQVVVITSQRVSQRAVKASD